MKRKTVIDASTQSSGASHKKPKVGDASAREKTDTPNQLESTASINLVASIGFDAQQCTIITNHPECDPIIAAIESIRNYIPHLLDPAKIMAMITVDADKTLNIFSKTCEFFQATDLNQEDLRKFFASIEGAQKLKIVYFTLIARKLNIQQCITVFNYEQCNEVLALLMSIRAEASQLLITPEQLMAMIATNSHRTLESLRKIYLFFTALSLEHSHIARLMGENENYMYCPLINTIISSEQFQAIAPNQQKQSEFFSCINEGSELDVVYDTYQKLISWSFNFEQCTFILSSAERRRIVVAINEIYNSAPQLLDPDQVQTMIKKDSDKTLNLVSEIYSFLKSLSLNESHIAELVKQEQDYSHLLLVSEVIKTDSFKAMASDNKAMCEFLACITSIKKLKLVSDAIIVPGLLEAKHGAAIMKHSEHHNIINAINVIRKKISQCLPTQTALLEMIQEKNYSNLIAINGFFTTVCSKTNPKLQQNFFENIQDFTQLCIVNQILIAHGFDVQQCIIIMAHVEYANIIRSIENIQKLPSEFQLDPKILLNIIETRGVKVLAWIRDTYLFLEQFLEPNRMIPFMGRDEGYLNIEKIYSLCQEWFEQMANSDSNDMRKLLLCIQDYTALCSFEKAYCDLKSLGASPSECLVILTHADRQKIIDAIPMIQYLSIKLSILPSVLLKRVQIPGGFCYISDLTEVYDKLHALKLKIDLIKSFMGDFENYKNISLVNNILYKFFETHKLSSIQVGGIIRNMKHYQKMESSYKELEQYHFTEAQIYQIMANDEYVNILSAIKDNYSILTLLKLNHEHIFFLVNRVNNEKKPGYSVLHDIRKIYFFLKDLKMSDSRIIQLTQYSNPGNIRTINYTFFYCMNFCSNHKLNNQTIITLMSRAENYTNVVEIKEMLDKLIKFKLSSSQIIILINLEKKMKTAINVFEKLELTSSEINQLINPRAADSEDSKKVDAFIEIYNKIHISLEKLKLSNAQVFDVILQLISPNNNGAALIALINNNIDFLVSLKWQPKHFFVLLNDKNADKSFALLINEHQLLSRLNFSVDELLQLFKKDLLTKNIVVLKKISRCNNLNFSSNQLFNWLNDPNDNEITIIKDMYLTLEKLEFTDEQADQLIVTVKEPIEDSCKALKTLKTFCQKYKQLDFSSEAIVKLMQHGAQEEGLKVYAQLVDLRLDLGKTRDLISYVEKETLGSLSQYCQLMVELEITFEHIEGFAVLSNVEQYIQEVLSQSNYLKKLAHQKKIELLNLIAFPPLIDAATKFELSTIGFNHLQMVILYSIDKNIKFLDEKNKEQWVQLKLTAEDIMSIIESKGYETFNRIIEMAEPIASLKFTPSEIVLFSINGFFDERDGNDLNKLYLNFQRLDLNKEQFLQFLNSNQKIEFLNKFVEKLFKFGFKSEKLLEVFQCENALNFLPSVFELKLVGKLNFTADEIIEIIRDDDVPGIVRELALLGEYKKTDFDGLNLTPRIILDIMSKGLLGRRMLDALGFALAFCKKLNYNVDEIRAIVEQEEDGIKIFKAIAQSYSILVDTLSFTADEVKQLIQDIKDKIVIIADAFGTLKNFPKESIKTLVKDEDGLKLMPQIKKFHQKYQSEIFISGNCCEAILLILTKKDRYDILYAINQTFYHDFDIVEFDGNHIMTLLEVSQYNLDLFTEILKDARNRYDSSEGFWSADEFIAITKELKYIDSIKESSLTQKDTQTDAVVDGLDALFSMDGYGDDFQVDNDNDNDDDLIIDKAGLLGFGEADNRNDMIVIESDNAVNASSSNDVALLGNALANKKTKLTNGSASTILLFSNDIQPKFLQLGFNNEQMAVVRNSTNKSEHSVLEEIKNIGQQLSLTAKNIATIVEQKGYKTLNVMTDAIKQIKTFKFDSDHINLFAVEGFFDETDGVGLMKLWNLGFSFEQLKQFRQYSNYVQIINVIVKGYEFFNASQIFADNLIEIMKCCKHDEQRYAIIKQINDSKLILIDLKLNTCTNIMTIAKIFDGCAILKKLSESSLTVKKWKLSSAHMMELIGNDTGVQAIEILNDIYVSLQKLCFKDEQVVKIVQILVKHKDDAFLLVMIFIKKYADLPGKNTEKLSPAEILLLCDNKNQIEKLKALMDSNILFLVKKCHFKYLDSISNEIITLLKNIAQELEKLNFNNSQMKQLMPDELSELNELAMQELQINCKKLKEIGFSCNEVAQIFTLHTKDQTINAIFRFQETFEQCTLSAAHWKPFIKGYIKIDDYKRINGVCALYQLFKAKEVKFEEILDLIPNVTVLNYLQSVYLSLQDSKKNIENISLLSPTTELLVSLYKNPKNDAILNRIFSELVIESSARPNKPLIALTADLQEPSLQAQSNSLNASTDDDRVGDEEIFELFDPNEVYGEVPRLALTRKRGRSRESLHSDDDEFDIVTEDDAFYAFYAAKHFVCEPVTDLQESSLQIQSNSSNASNDEDKGVTDGQMDAEIFKLFDPNEVHSEEQSVEQALKRGRGRPRKYSYNSAAESDCSSSEHKLLCADLEDFLPESVHYNNTSPDWRQPMLSSPTKGGMFSVQGQCSNSNSNNNQSYNRSPFR